MGLATELNNLKKAVLLLKKQDTEINVELDVVVMHIKPIFTGKDPIKIGQVDGGEPEDELNFELVETQVKDAWNTAIDSEELWDIKREEAWMKREIDYIYPDKKDRDIKKKEMMATYKFGPRK